MTLRPNSLWYKDAIIYEVHVRAFYDSVTDGMGDFGGLAQKLDYLEDLGVTAIWLLPFCPSPWRDDGYDISDYNDVHPAYGTLSDFQKFVREAHRRGLKVITELVLNHTSDQHVWFQRSRRAAPGSKWRDFYVWSDTPDRYRDARIIFKDFEASNWTWDPVARSYFWHRFYSHQPDLNWDNPDVRQAMFEAMDFWFDLGVDGLRLDAVPYLFEREGTNCENLVETHEALRELRAHVDRKYQNRMLLAEANQWPEDSVAYFGKGDECHMAFHFPVMPRLFMGLRMEDRYPITDILRITPAVPENCQWAMFLRNHDELTLEMVTDEERDYMYRSYAHDRQMRINLGIRRRLAPLLENDRRRIELMNALLFSLPGTPVVYYGDEIGMGDNVYLGDRNGVRTPMQWSADRNAGFSRCNPQKLYLPVIIDPAYHYEAVNVEAQQNNPHSLLWWMKRIIAQRKQFKAFGRGRLDFLYPTNRKVLAFIRHYEDEKVLVVANLSRFAQCTELDLSAFAGQVPVEVFGRSAFAAIGDSPYFLSLGPYAFYWFNLQPREATQESLVVRSQGEALPVIEVLSEEELFQPATRSALERVLQRLLPVRPWFLAKGRRIRTLSTGDVIRLPETSAYVMLLHVEFTDGDPEIYVAGVSVAQGEQAEAILRDNPESVLAEVRGMGTRALVYAAILDRAFADALLRGFVKRKRFKGKRGELVAGHTPSFRKAWAQQRSSLEPQALSGDRPATLIQYGEDFVFKLYRKIEVGPNPDREIEEFLTEHTDFACVPRALGWLEYRHTNDDESTDVTTLGLLTSFVRNATNGWAYTLDALSIYFERALAIASDDPRLQELTTSDPLTLSTRPVPAVMAELLDTFVDDIRTLGRRTAEFHRAMSSRPEMPDFAPEPFTDFYRHGLYHGMFGRVGRAFDSLRQRVRFLDADSQREASALLEREAEVAKLLHPMRDERAYVTRIRIHGDYHLGQIHFTGSDVVVHNFEGDTRRPMSERRIKRSALSDVASMIRSLHYASHAALFGRVPGIVVSDAAQLERWARAWYGWMSAEFLRSYLHAAGQDDYVPRSARELRNLLTAYMVEKAVLEIQHELELRPDWIRIPVHGIMEQLTNEHDK